MAGDIDDPRREGALVAFDVDDGEPQPTARIAAMSARLIKYFIVARVPLVSPATRDVLLDAAP